MRAKDPANNRNTEIADSCPVCPLWKLVPAWISCDKHTFISLSVLYLTVTAGNGLIMITQEEVD